MKIGEADGKQKYFWNMAGSVCSATLSVILLLAVNRILGEEEGGFFSLAYANAQLMMVIGGFEVRALQSTDIKSEFRFQTYFTLRVITIVLMLMICAVYAGSFNFGSPKGKAVMVFGAYKAVEALADVFSGMFQQQDRIDLCGKASALRMMVSTIVFVSALLICRDLSIAGICMTTASFFLLFLYDLPLAGCFRDTEIWLSFKKIKTLFWAAVPLFISAFIMMYINNAPRYAIEAYCTDVEQNVYGILYMPSFVMHLFSLFLFRPVLVDMKAKWDSHDVAAVKRYMQKSSLFILAIAILCIWLGVWIGLPVFSIMYGIDLKIYKNTFIIILLYGMFNAYNNYFYYVLAVMRKQKKIMSAYILALACMSFLAPYLVRNQGLSGAALSSVLTAAVLTVVLLVLSMITMAGHKKAAFRLPQSSKR